VSPLSLRPQVRLPWQAIAAFAAALYVLRSALRGWDFRPDPLDLVIFGTLAVVLAARPLITHFLTDGTDEHDDN
jgi:hypothetical protein